jgi:hypothetical protein
MVLQEDTIVAFGFALGYSSFDSQIKFYCHQKKKGSKV